MTNSVSVIPDSISPEQSKPIVLDLLPDLPISTQRCALHLQQQIDLILLAIEALELGGSEYMLATARELELQNIIKNRVVLWRLRCSNHWRRSYTRIPLQLDQAKALVIIAGHRAKQLMVLTRQLLVYEQQMREKNFPLEANFRISEYLERFRAHFRSRMNPRRTKVALYLSSEQELNELAMYLLAQLLFCTGTTGIQRFWISLFDGEVA
jgi:hypothetical protein